MNEKLIIVVATKNIVWGCGKKVLAKNRIVAKKNEDSEKIYKSLEDYNRGITSDVPFWNEKFYNNFRKATDAENAQFMSGGKHCAEVVKNKV